MTRNTAGKRHARRRVRRLSSKTRKSKVEPIFVQEEKTMRLWKNIVMVGLGVLLLTSSAPAAYDDHDDYSDSHPLRLIAYIFHPIGYTVEWLALRPLHAL